MYGSSYLGNPFAACYLVVVVVVLSVVVVAVVFSVIGIVVVVVVVVVVDVAVVLPPDVHALSTPQGAHPLEGTWTII